MKAGSRAIAVAVCVTLIAAGLTVAQVARGSENEAHRPKVVDLLESEAPEPKRPPLPAGSGVSWTASRPQRPASEPANERARPEVLKELPERRDERTRVFANRDGTLTVQAYLTPIHYRTIEGWQPIDNTLSPDPEMPGWLRTLGNSWAASFGPASLGVRLQTPEGNIRMVPVRSSDTEENPKPEIHSSPTPRPTDPKELLATFGIPEPGVVRYEDVWPETEVRYEVHADALKEQILLKSPGAPSQFSFDLVGASLRLDEDGGLRIGEDIGSRFHIPPPTVMGADGSNLTEGSGVRYTLVDSPSGRSRVSVDLDSDWLESQPQSVFPLVVDPSFTFSAANDVVTINHSNQIVSSTAPTISVGAQSNVKYRAAMHFAKYEEYLNQGYRCYQASIAFSKQDESLAGTLLNVYDQGTYPAGSRPTTFDEIGTDVPLAGSESDPNGLQLPFVYVTPTVDQWFAKSLVDRWFGVVGNESGNTRHDYKVFLNLELYAPPKPSRVTNLTANQVLATTTPTLNAQEVSPNEEAGVPDPTYDYQITTAPAPGTGLIVSSGRLRQNVENNEPVPSWPVPPGSLQEGVTYYAWVLTDWYINSFQPGAEEVVPPSGWGVPFTVKLGFGEGGPSPTDEVGAVPGQTSTPSEGAPNPSLPPSKVTVNLVDGNASISVATPKLESVSGGLGLRFTYNSLAAVSQDAYGLRANYYNDTNDNDVIDVGTDPLVGERVDPTVSFDLLAWQRLVAGQDSVRALAEWNGFLTLPNTNLWQLGAISSDGIKITSGTTVLLDDYAPHAPQESPTFGSSFPATSTTPINVQWHHSSSNRAVAQVFAKDMGSCDVNGENCEVYALSPDWLTRAPKVLPAGWVLNVAATSGRWVGLADHGDSVTLFADNGSGHAFTAAGGGKYKPPSDAPHDLLSVNGDGKFVLQSAGLTYTFGPTGALLSLVSAADDRNPAALQYSYSGAPPLLRTITDRVRCAGASPCPAASKVTLSYGGDVGAPAACLGPPAAPTGLLCNIAYWDGTSTALTYELGTSRLQRITNPGSVAYDFAYDTCTRLTDVRDPLANAAIAAGVRADDATTRTQLSYDSACGSQGPGRVKTITQPAPSAGALRPKRLYCYDFAAANTTTMTCQTSAKKTTSVGVVGFSPTVGYAQQVKYDDRNRIVASSDSAGLTTKYTWDEFDRLVAKIDPAGIESSTQYDTLGHAVASYGPAPATSFEPNGLPKSGETVPTTTNTYDGGIGGLAVAWYPNVDLLGNPAYHTTSSLAESWAGACNSPSSCDGAGSLIPSSGFSGHLSGKLTLPQPGRVSFDGNGGRVFVDDRPVIDRRDGPYASTVRTDHPQNWWRLGELPGTPTATDSAGANAGTYIGGVTLGQPGPLAGDDNKAVSFNGTTGTVAVPDTPSLRFDRTQPFSVEVWVKTTAGSIYQALVSKITDVSPKRGWELALANGQPRFHLINTNGSNVIRRDASTNIADGAWHHVVATYDGSSQAAGLNFYIDGQLDAATTVFDSLTGTTLSTTPLKIGSRDNSIYWFNGTLSDVAVYPQALTQAQVAAHHGAAPQTSFVATSPVVYNTPYPKAVNESAPISYWRLGEASGTTAADSNGASPGTYTGGVTLGQPGPLPGDPATAASFNGTNGTVTVPDAPSLRFNQKQPFSVEAWVKTTSTATQAIVAKMASASPNRGWALRLDSGKPVFRLINTVNTNDIRRTAATSVADGAWHHVVVTYDGSSRAAGARFYIDGRPEAATTINDGLTASPVSTTAMTIGSRDGSGLWFNGTLSDVAVHPVALSGFDIATHFGAGLHPYPRAVQDEGASSYWRLAERTGTDALDLIGTKAPGSYIGGVTLGQPGPLSGDGNTGVSFNGSTGTVRVVDGPSIRFDRTQPFTVEVWVKTVGTGSFSALVSKMTDVSPKRGWELGLGGDGRPRFNLINTAGSNVIRRDASTVIIDGAWHHVAATYDGSGQAAGLNFYIDGQLDAASTVFDSLTGSPSSTASLNIGSRDNTIDWFSGTLANVAVYPHTLSAEEVASHRTTGVTAPPGPDPVHRIEVEAQQFVAGGHLNLTSGVPGATFGPNYGLLTQTTDPDGKVTETRYSDPGAGISPKFGIPTATVQDPAGLALETKTTYETPGPTTYLRRVAKILPAGNQTTYTNYGGAEGPIAAVCGVASGTRQAGLPKQQTDPTPAAGAARVAQYVYDAIGRQVGRRSGTVATISSVGWSCTGYDAAGRMTTQSWPAFAGQPARTVTYTYAVSNNPLVNQVTDTNWPGKEVSSTVDLLGRTTSYTDIWGNTTTTTYDQAGRVTDTNGPVGARHSDYNSAGRVSAQKLGGQTLATPSYNATNGRLQSVSYPTGSGNGGNGTSASVGYDSSGRQNALTFNKPGGSLLTSDQTTLSAAGRVATETIDQSPASTFTYDGAGRLSSATVPGHSISYGYAPSGGCGPLATAGANTNRTSVTDNGVVTTSCYDAADRLLSTTDARYASVAYDDHGNTTTLGNQSIVYDASDRHVGTFTSGTDPAAITYRRDPLDRIAERDVGVGFRSASTADNGQTGASTLVLPKPAGAASGDVMVMHVSASGGAGVSLTPPPGWTVVKDTPNAAAVRGTSMWKAATASEPPDYTVTFSVPVPASGGIGAFLGADPAAPVESSSEATATGASVAVPSITASAGARVLGLFAFSASGVTPPTEQTERWERSTPGALTLTSAGSDEARPASGATGTRTATSANTGLWAGHLVSLRPLSTTPLVRYGFTGHEDTPSLELSGSGAVLNRTIGLIGGVVLTRLGTAPASGDVWSYPNLHGDISATANGSGTKTGGTFTYDPFGQPLAGEANNTSTPLSYGWVGGKQKLTERQGGIATIEMGARQYVPGLGRFLSVDPIEGGCANDYAFAFGDPVNYLDLDGQRSGPKCPIDTGPRARVIVGLISGGISIVAGAASIIAGVFGAPESAGVSLALVVVGAAQIATGFKEIHDAMRFEARREATRKKQGCSPELYPGAGTVP